MSSRLKKAVETFLAEAPVMTLDLLEGNMRVADTKRVRSRGGWVLYKEVVDWMQD